MLCGAIMRAPWPVLVLFAVGLAGVARADERAAVSYRTYEDRLAVPRYASPGEWQRRATYLGEHILASSGLLPLPEKTPLRPQVFDEQKHEDYSVAKVYFESLPGFFVTGNLYVPAGPGPFPAVLLPHGHWSYGRLENAEISSIPTAASSSSSSRRARENGVRSAVACTSTSAPSPVITTFMSTSAVESSE